MLSTREGWRELHNEISLPPGGLWQRKGDPILFVAIPVVSIVYQTNLSPRTSASSWDLSLTSWSGGDWQHLPTLKEPTKLSLPPDGRTTSEPGHYTALSTHAMATISSSCAVFVTCRIVSTLKMRSVCVKNVAKVKIGTSRFGARL